MSHDVIERLHFSNCALIWLKVMQSFNSIVFKINFEFNIEDVSRRGLCAARIVGFFYYK